MDKDLHVIDLLPAYALGCLDEDEAELVSVHLETCSYCSAELQEYQQVSGQMALAVPQIEPPERVKTELMARIRGAANQGKQRTPLLSWRQRIFGDELRLSPAWSVAGLAVVLLLAVSNLLLWQQVRDMRARQPEALQVVALGATEFAPGASGMIVISQDGKYGTLVVDHLPALGEERQYQLWLIDNGVRTSGAIFSVHEEGYGSLVIDSHKPLDSYSGFGITIEPNGGSPGPTGEKVLGGNL